MSFAGGRQDCHLYPLMTKYFNLFLNSETLSSFFPIRKIHFYGLLFPEQNRNLIFVFLWLPNRNCFYLKDLFFVIYSSLFVGRKYFDSLSSGGKSLHFDVLKVIKFLRFVLLQGCRISDSVFKSGTSGVFC